MITSEFHYPEVGAVTITGGWHHRGEYPFSMEYTVVGENGVVEFSSDGRPAKVYWKDGTNEALETGDADPYRAEIEYFAECCKAGRAPELCMPAESALAVKATKLMVDARERGGEKVRCAFGG
jgi:predicted dehydrogenase